MVPLFISLGNLLQLMVIRDSEAHVNGQFALTKTYSIFQDVALRDPRQSKSKEGTLHLDVSATLNITVFLPAETLITNLLTLPMEKSSFRRTSWSNL